MILRLVLAALVLAGLVAWERALAADAADARTARASTVGPLLPPERREGMLVAALRVESGGRVATYARLGGAWRVAEAHAAPADGRAVEAVIGKVRGAEGRVQTDEPDHAARYGIGTRDTLRVTLLGPSLEEHLVLDVGAPTPGGGGAYVRVAGSPEVWAVDADPREELSRRPPAPHLPALLDPTVVSRLWLERSQGGVTRLFVDRAGGASFELERRDVPVTPEELQRGALPHEWILRAGEGADEERPPVGRATAYVYHLLTAPLVDVLDPARAEELVLRAPVAKITAAPAEGDPLVLAFGAPLPDGRVPVVNGAADTLVAVAPATAALLLPDADELRDGSRPNRWEAALEALRAGW